MTADRRAAVPAVLALAGCGLLTAVVLLRNATPPISSLREQLARASAAQDDRASLLLQQHLAALEPDRPENLVDMARTLNRLDRRREAVAVLLTVAPEAGGGYAPAHLQLADWVVEARMMTGRADPADIISAKRHAAAAKTDPRTAARAAELEQTLDGL